MLCDTFPTSGFAFLRVFIGQKPKMPLKRPKIHFVNAPFSLIVAPMRIYSFRLPYLAIAFLFIFIQVSCRTSKESASPAAGKVTVSSAEELIRAIRPGAHIVIKAGTYDLTSASGIKTNYVSWEEVYDGLELQVKGVKNLRITGEGEVTLLAKPTYAWVFSFFNAENIQLENLIMGHEFKGNCVGGVTAFTQSSNIRILGCRLFGSGTEGIRLDHVSNFACTGSIITECSYDLLTFVNSSNIRFERVDFTRTGEYDLITMESCSSVAFEGCTFSENFNGEFMPYFFNLNENTGDVMLTNCVFENNRVQKWSNRPEKLIRKSCSFSGNQFQDASDSDLSKP